VRGDDGTVDHDNIGVYSKGGTRSIAIFFSQAAKEWSAPVEFSAALSLKNAHYFFLLFF
jgi:hypothetical protein